MDTLKALYNQRADLATALAALVAIDEGDERELTTEETEQHTQACADLEAIDAKIERLKAAKAIETRAPSAPVEPGQPSRIAFGPDHSLERPWGPTLHADATDEMRVEADAAALGEWAIAARKASNGLGADPRLFAATGDSSGMNTAVPSEGGFAVPSEIAPGIEREMLETGAITSRVDTRTITGDSIAYNVIDVTSQVDGSRQGGIRAYWVDQGTAATKSKTTIARLEMKLRKVGVLNYLTDELVADAAAFGGEVRAMVIDEVGFAVEDAIFEGDGAGKPQGFTNANCVVSIAKETGQAAATIVGENITKMWARMSPRSHANAVWLANVDTIPQLSVMTLDIGTAGTRYPFASVNNGSLSLWGRPVIYVPYASTLGTVDDIVLADLSKYRLVRKSSGVEQSSSIHVRFTQGEETIRTFYRVDGQAVPRSAVTPFKGSNTTSPFIVLATRS